MPIIEMYLPGEKKIKVEPFSETYRVTVERLDGIACSDIEARTVMGFICIHSEIEKKAKRRNLKPRSACAEAES